MTCAAKTLCSLVMALTIGACATTRNSIPDNYVDPQPTVSYLQESSLLDNNIVDLESTAFYEQEKPEEDRGPEIIIGAGAQYHPGVLTFQFRDKESGFFTRKNVGLYLPRVGLISASIVDITKKEEGNRIFGFGGIDLKTKKLARLRMFDVSGGINFSAFDGIDPFEGGHIAFKEYTGTILLESDYFDKLQGSFSYNTSGKDNLTLSINPRSLSRWLIEFNSSLQGRLITRGDDAGDLVLRSTLSLYLSLEEFHFGPFSFGPFEAGPELVCIFPVYTKSNDSTSCIPAVYAGLSLKAGL